MVDVVGVEVAWFYFGPGNLINARRVTRQLRYQVVVECRWSLPVTILQQVGLEVQVDRPGKTIRMRHLFHPAIRVVVVNHPVDVLVFMVLVHQVCFIPDLRCHILRLWRNHDLTNSIA